MSHFDQHMRAVLDYPLGSKLMAAPVVVMATCSAGTPPPRTGPDPA